MHPVFENSILYTAIEMSRANLSPMRFLIKSASNWTGSPFNPFAYTKASRSFSATYELADRITRHYPKPAFGIESTVLHGQTEEVSEEIIWQKPFCNLLHFKKNGSENQPKLLIVAPMSGHHATLLRGTVIDTLPFFDVYITDWLSARDVPLSVGKFDLDDFINYTIDIMEFLGKDVNVMAVCQPAVPVLAAVAIMSSEHNPATPASMILIGGPIDTRESPTEVNNFAQRRSMNWFESNVITRVPANYPGFMRPVYPGFIQLAGFMAMNMQRHVGEHMKLFTHLVVGDGESAEAHRKFYNEYLAVMDLPAEFYLQTIQTVFKNHALPKGTMVSRGRPIALNSISKTALMVIEGELDDISGVGQTKASLHLCTQIPDAKKHYHLQEKVGHYGLFNGRRFREQIVPAILHFVENAAAKKPAKILSAAL